MVSCSRRPTASQWRVYFLRAISGRWSRAGGWLVLKRFYSRKKCQKSKNSSKVNFSPKVVASPAYGGLGAGGGWPAACRQLETNAWARHGAGMLRLRLLAARAHRPSRAHAFVSSSKGTNQIKSNFRKWPLWGHYTSNIFFRLSPPGFLGTSLFDLGKMLGS